MSPPFTFPVDTAMVGQAHAAGPTVTLSASTRRPNWRASSTSGVDAIITNHPDVPRKILQEKGITVPKPTPRPEQPRGMMKG
ncbi:MAG: hypothetical protein ABI112_15155 [Terracoccus sp.]